jgi:hypothetical protein
MDETKFTIHAFNHVEQAGNLGRADPVDAVLNTDVCHCTISRTLRCRAAYSLLTVRSFAAALALPACSARIAQMMQTTAFAPSAAICAWGVVIGASA